MDMSQMDRDPAVLVLMDHCRQMKKQEWRLRAATAFLLLGGAAFLVLLSIRAGAPPTMQKDPAGPETTEVAFASQTQVGEHTAKPAAHLIASSEIFNPEIIHWQHQDDLQNFEHREGDLIVHKSGRYHVYLQVTYRKPESYNCSHGDEFIMLRPVVEKWHDSYPEYLPMMSASDYLPCKQIYEKSIYTAGMYNLQMNSKLRVRYGAMRELAVHTDEHKIFFGAYLI